MACGIFLGLFLTETPGKAYSTLESFSENRDQSRQNFENERLCPRGQILDTACPPSRAAQARRAGMLDAG